MYTHTAKGSLTLAAGATLSFSNCWLLTFESYAAADTFGGPTASHANFGATDNTVVRLEDCQLMAPTSVRELQKNVEIGVCT